MIPLGCMQCRIRLNRVRGLCDCCYNKCLATIHSGKTTWQLLEQQGKCLPKRKPGNQHTTELSRDRTSSGLLEQVYSTVTGPISCTHGKQDGECPICEKQQRAELGIGLTQKGHKPLDIPVFKAPASLKKGRR